MKNSRVLNGRHQFSLPLTNQLSGQGSYNGNFHNIIPWWVAVLIVRRLTLQWMKGTNIYQQWQCHILMPTSLQRRVVFRELSSAFHISMRRGDGKIAVIDPQIVMNAAFPSNEVRQRNLHAKAKVIS